MQVLLDPSILFFVFGLLAGLAKSNLEIPPAISRFLSLYLLMALGLKGGFALAHTGLTPDVARSLGAALLLAVAVPLAGFAVLRRLLGGFDAAAVAATYGSVSAVTFITAVAAAEARGMAPGGHVAAALALMESPAILLAVLMAHVLRRQAALAAAPAGVQLQSGGTATLALGGGAGSGASAGLPWRHVLHEALTDGAQLLLLGAMVVGLLTGDAGKAALAPFSVDLFKGMLAFFLLDMGLLAARNLGALRGQRPALLGYAVVGPLLHAAVALGLAMVLGLGAGDGGLLMVLAASASYIAVPAVLRHAMPEANPALYVGLSLGLTFPLNILFGIPLYLGVAQRVLG